MHGHILAGWRRERMPEMPDAPYFELAPDWIREVLSPSTAATDRADKMPIYAETGVRHVWLIDPIARGRRVRMPVLGRRQRRSPVGKMRKSLSVRSVHEPTLS